MIIDDSIANYSRYHTRDICSTIRQLSQEQKQQLLVDIQSHKGVCSLKEQEYDQGLCKYVESLLNGKRPRK